jgi:transglutaminase superfamily protein
VLARHIGDCTEHSLLLTALARAAGIPARPVAGITYMGDELRKFGWHEWVEVALDGHWVQVDPSWAEPVANATHIKLEEDDSGRSVALYGVIRLERVEPGEESPTAGARKRPPGG